MIIWSGLGFLVPLIFIVMAVLFIILFPEGSDRISNIAIYLSLTAIFWPLGKWMEGKSKGKTYIDKETNQEVVIKAGHTFFFIPIKYWSFVTAGLTIVMIAKYFL